MLHLRRRAIVSQSRWRGVTPKESEVLLSFCSGSSGECELGHTCVVGVLFTLRYSADTDSLNPIDEGPLRNTAMLKNLKSHGLSSRGVDHSRRLAVVCRANRLRDARSDPAD
jgi:hypothetical protein